MAEAREQAGQKWSTRLVLVLVVLWGVVLLVAYAYEHLGAIQAVSRPAQGESDGPGFVPAFGAFVRSAISSVAIIGASVGYGSLIRSVGLGSLGFGRVVDRCAELMLGGGVMAVAMFLLGHAGWLVAIPSLLLICGGWIAMAVTQRRERKHLWAELAGGHPTLKFDLVVLAGAVGIAAALVLALLIALAPPTARDALAYHLAAPKAYIAGNGIIELPWNVLSYSPFAIEMLFTLGLLLGPDTSPNLIHLGYGVAVALLVVIVTHKATGSARWATLAGLSFASVPSVIWNAGIAHNEMWLALAVTVAALALGRWWETGDRRLLFWTGAAVGIALSAKHTALLFAPIPAVVVLVRARSFSGREQMRTLVWGAFAALLALSFPLPWYVQNAVRTGNPVFPFFWNAFRTHSQVWDATRAGMLDDYVRVLYGQSDGVLSWIRLPWDVSIRAQNDIPALFDGVVGPVFIFLAPVMLILFTASRTEAWLRVTVIVAATFTVIWATQSQQIRFLIPALPVLLIGGVTAAAGLSHWRPSLSAVRLAIVGLLAGVIVLNLSIVAVDVFSAAPDRPVLGLESRSAYLSRRLGYFPYYERLNREIGSHQRVLLVNMRNDGYYLDVPFISDSVFEDYTVGRIVNEAASASAVRDAIRGLGVTHILVREDILLDSRFTPFDGPAAAARWSGFLQADAKRLESRDGIVLYELKN